jgi:hypothetical protein
LANALNRSVSAWESPRVLEQDTDALIGHTLRQLGVANVGPRAIREAMSVPASNGATLLPQAPELLRAIDELGLRTVLVSNTAWRDARAYRRDFEFFGVSEHIHSIITSLDVGFRKPHQANLSSRARRSRMQRLGMCRYGRFRGEGHRACCRPRHAVNPRRYRATLSRQDRCPRNSDVPSGSPRPSATVDPVEGRRCKQSYRGPAVAGLAAPNSHRVPRLGP